MRNVYDILDTMYNNVFSEGDFFTYEQLDAYLSRRSWDGASEEEMEQDLHYLYFFFYYLNYTEQGYQLLRPGKFAAAAVWCCRNFGEFTLDYTYIKGFLTTLDRLYGQEYKWARPLEDLQLLYDNEELFVCDYEGQFYLREPAFYFGLKGSDMEEISFFNYGVTMNCLMEILQKQIKEKEAGDSIDSSFTEYLTFLSLGDDWLLGSRTRIQSLWFEFLLDYRIHENKECWLQWLLSDWEPNLRNSGEKAAFCLSRILITAPKAYVVVDPKQKEAMGEIYRDIFTGEILDLRFVPWPVMRPREGMVKEGWLFKDGIFFTMQLDELNFDEQELEQLQGMGKAMLSCYNQLNGTELTWEQFITTEGHLLKGMLFDFSRIHNVDDFSLPEDFDANFTLEGDRQ